MLSRKFELRAPKGQQLTAGQVRGALAGVPDGSQLRAETSWTGKLIALIIPIHSEDDDAKR